MGTVSFSRLQRLLSAYLDEEAALAQRQALATSHSLARPRDKSNITIRDPKIKRNIRNSLFVEGALYGFFLLLCIGSAEGLTLPSLPNASKSD